MCICNSAYVLQKRENICSTSPEPNGRHEGNTGGYRQIGRNCANFDSGVVREVNGRTIAMVALMTLGIAFSAIATTVLVITGFLPTWEGGEELSFKLRPGFHTPHLVQPRCTSFPCLSLGACRRMGNTLP